MLRYEGDLFLDNISVGDIERALGVRVTVVEANAVDFIRKVF
jgi:NifB/MoaA-like Fe-S oxidoreductase